jgi:hypothetical protein
MQSRALTKTPINSSSIASVAYSTDASLDVEFRSGAVYRYFAVPRSILDSLLAAESKGAFLNKFIRDRFPYVRVDL